MKRTMLLIIGLIAGGAGMSFGETELIREGAARARIYYAPLEHDGQWIDRGEFGRLSVQDADAKALAISIVDLNYHFKEMSGTELDIVVTDDPRSVKPPAIVIGSLANRMGAAPDIEDDPSNEAFRLKSAKNMMLIGGASDFGASHGIYTMLRKLGCDWVMPGPEGEIIPEMTTVTIPDMDIQEAPCFFQRDIWYGGRPSAEQWQDLQTWCLRHKANLSGAKKRFGFRYGPHAWGGIIRRFKKEFDENPEMMGLIMRPDGTMVRGGSQFETTHPGVIEIAIEHIRRTFKANEWPNDASVCIPMGPSDGGALSRSPETVNAGVSRVNYESGRPDGTDIVVLFMNTILERTSEEFPNLHLGFMVYSWHADYPMRYKPHPRIVAAIRDINFSRFHGMTDLTSKSRAYYKDIVMQWGRLAREQGNQVSHGSYSWNLAEAVMPYTRLKIDGKDFPIYKEAGITVKGMNLTTDWYLTAPHSYLGARMAWNTGLDWRDVLREYCEKSFGEQAAPFMESYYIELARRQSESSHETGCFYSIPLIFDQAFVAGQQENFDAALRSAGTEMDRKRIGYARYPLETLRHYLEMRDAYAQFDFAKALEHFAKATNCLEEITSQNPHFTNGQGKRYFSRFEPVLASALKYSSGDYAIEYRIPNRLKTAIDMHNLGQNNRFWGSRIDDSSYLTTETYMSTWDAQGLSGFQQGSAWYRVHFKLSESAQRDGGFGLFVGGADNRLAVWCNDQFIARTSAGARAPRTFDITDAVQPGQDNLIVIQVTRHGIHELFTGGIMMPSFVFSGPRVEQPEDTEPPFRILPGGVVEYIR